MQEKVKKKVKMASQDLESDFIKASRTQKSIQDSPKPTPRWYQKTSPLELFGRDASKKPSKTPQNPPKDGSNTYQNSPKTPQTSRRPFRTVPRGKRVQQPTTKNHQLDGRFAALGVPKELNVEMHDGGIAQRT